VDVRTYVVEQYVPAAEASLAETAERVRLAADELAREGRSVRYLRSIVIPDDDTCFHVFEGSCADDVREASRRAALDYDRIVEALQ
jgi:hypothetical protein